VGFDSRDTATKYTPQDGDTLEEIAERETANGNPLTAAEIALFNWGTDDPEVIDEHLRDELDCYRRGEDNRFLISSDSEPRSDLLLPQRFEESGLPINQTHTIRVRKLHEPPPQFEACARVRGIFFETAKSFIRPSVVGDLKRVEEALTRHPDAKALIFGHTDKVGGEEDNKDLSERRALSTFAFITDDADTWEELYNQEDWGTRAIQEILKDFGPPYDPGPVDGIYGPQTRRAVSQYQTDRGLGVDGIAGPITRKEMFTEYMTSKHDVKLAPDSFMDPKHVGCGELNPLEETEGPSESNRRVMFYLFNEGRLPAIPCREGDLSACQRQATEPLPRYRENFRCSFYDSISHRCPWEKPVPTVPLKIIDFFGRPRAHDYGPAEPHALVTPAGCEIYLQWKVSGADRVSIEETTVRDGTQKCIVMPDDGQIENSEGLDIGLIVVRPTVATNYLLSASSPSAEEVDYQTVMVTPFPSVHPASAMTAHFWGDFLRLEPPYEGGGST